MEKLGLNSVALTTIAQTMRDQTAPPNNEMSYSDFAGSTATYAVINAMELLASGLKAEEMRQIDAMIENMRIRDSYRRQAFLDGGLDTEEHHE